MTNNEFTFGANILENLTTGMYRDPLVLYREYIQNACDSIDNAVESKVLPSKEKGKIEIWIDKENRIIEIEDNGIGIPALDFKRVLGNIADSDKTLGEDKGFRGIGRLCGLAYCKKLIFTSKIKGENQISRLTCDAEKMRRLLAEHQSKQKKYLASEILSEIYEFSNDKSTDIESHFFKVVLEDVDSQNNNLLDTIQIKEYLSFVAPVPYQNTFFYRNKIYAKAKEIGTEIDEYSVKVCGEDIFKRYVTILKDKNGVKYDEVDDVAFKCLYNSKGVLIAWLWVGITQFKQAIPKINPMRGLRLRKHNIQIGDEDALQKLFKEDRGNNYFIGEVFALDKNLIPNSQRDYFNQNQERGELEIALKQFFDNEGHTTYYFGSYVNSRYKKIDKYEAVKNEYHMEEKSGFAGAEHKKQKEKELIKAENEAKKALREIEKKFTNVSPDTLLGRVAKAIQKKREDIIEPILPETTEEKEDIIVKPKKTWRVDKLSSLNKQERKLVGRIFDIIFTVTDKETAEKIVCKIEDALK